MALWHLLWRTKRRSGLVSAFQPDLRECNVYYKAREIFQELFRDANGRADLVVLQPGIMHAFYTQLRSVRKIGRERQGRFPEGVTALSVTRRGGYRFEGAPVQAQEIGQRARA